MKIFKKGNKFVYYDDNGVRLGSIDIKTERFTGATKCYPQLKSALDSWLHRSNKVFFPDWLCAGNSQEDKFELQDQTLLAHLVQDHDLTLKELGTIPCRWYPVHIKLHQAKEKLK